MLMQRPKDYLQFYAVHSPDAVALIHNGREYTFGQFHRDLPKFTKAIRKLGLSVGDIVAICCTDLYIHLLLIMACEDNGMVTASFLENEDSSCLALLSKACLVIADDGRFAANVPKFSHLTVEWLNDIFFLEDDSDGPDSISPVGTDDPVRLIRSSGTTGSQKMMLKTREMLEGEINRSATFFSKFTHPSRCLFTLPLSVGATYRRYMLHIQLGITSIYDSTMSTFNSLVTYDVNFLATIPAILERLLNDMPPSFVKPPGVVVLIFGAALPDEIRRRTVARLATTVVEVYGTNEADMIAVVDGTGVGTVAPGVEVEIVDEDDNRLPWGMVGRIRLTAPGLVQGYVNDPEATAAVFRNGFFYPGDVGIMSAPRRLKVLGRHDDLLNIGGLKIEPGTIEKILLGIEPLRSSIEDLAVTSIENANGIGEICVAVVANGQAEHKSITDHIRKTLPVQYGNVHIKLIRGIPRTVSGKIRRYLLKSEFLT